MAQLYVDLTISAADALAAGQTRAGVMRVPLTAAILEPLTAEERAELARACTEDEGKGVHYELRLTVRSVSPEGIAAAVRERIAERAAKAANAAEKQRRIDAIFAGPREARVVHAENKLPGEQWSERADVRELIGYSDSHSDKRLRAEIAELNRADERAHDSRLLDEPAEQHVVQDKNGAWEVRAAVSATRHTSGPSVTRYPRAYARAQELASARNAERKAAQKAEYEAVLREALSAEQWERYEAGVLPTDERDSAVRAHLFAGVDLSEYARITDDDVSHDEGCSDPDVDYDTTSFSELSGATMGASEYAAAKRLLAAFGAHPRLDSIVWVLHTAECSDRDCSGSVERYGARVTLRVNGHTYSREYAIT